MTLEPAGHRVLEAVDGEAALVLISPDPLPDVITTDLQMPLLSGLGLIEKLRSVPRTASIPIVVVSANPDLAHELHLAGLVEAVLMKPFDPSVLEACIRAVTSRPVNGAHTSTSVQNL